MHEVKDLVFHALDYVTFFCVLVLSILIGLYSGFKKSNKTTEEYLLGSRKQKTFPVAMSLIASSVSGFTIIGYPTEVYQFGSDFFYFILSMIIMTVIFYFAYLPVLYRLRITTLYEYLEKRFDNKVRVLCSMLYTIHIIIFIPVILCLSSVTFSRVSGINFYGIVIVSGAVTTFYTAIGGFKAVIWTDVVQTFFMACGVVVLTVKGTMDVGGFHVVMERNYNGSRLDPPRMSLSLTDRYNFWEWIFGNSLFCLTAYGLTQGMVQRYISVPTLEIAKRCLLISSFGSILFIGLSCYNGLLMYATFYDCDPLTSQKIMAKDQLLSLLTMNTLENMPGVPGLFIAAIISATLSTISTLMNSIAAVVLQDYYRPWVGKNFSDSKARSVMILTVVILGVVSTGMVFLVQKLGSALQVVFALFGAVSGPILGIFTLGIYSPWVKSKAAIFGSLSGFILVSWMSIGAQMATFSGDLVLATKPFSVEGCEHNVTISNSYSTTHSNGDVLDVYKVSSLWYTTIGFLTTMVSALLLSLFLEKNDISKMDYRLYSPLLQHQQPPKLTKTSSNVELSMMNGY